MTMSSLLRGAVSDNVQKLPARRSCAVLPGASAASAGGNSLVRGSGSLSAHLPLTLVRRRPSRTRLGAIPAMVL